MKNQKKIQETQSAEENHLKRERPPFTLLENAIVEDKRISKHGLIVYWMLCKHADENGENSFPGLQTIVKESRSGKTTVVAAIKELVAAGYIRKEQRRDPKHPQEYTSNLYTITSQYEYNKKREKKGGVVLRADYPSPVQDYPSPEGGRYLDPLNKIPLTNLCFSDFIKQERKKLKKRGIIEYPEEFGDFWGIYPRPENKKKTFKCWLACLEAGATLEDLLKAASGYRSKCEQKKTAKEWIKLSATFLRPDEPWRDYTEGNNHQGERENSNGGQGQIKKICPACGYIDTTINNTAASCCRCGLPHEDRGNPEKVEEYREMYRESA